MRALIAAAVCAALPAVLQAQTVGTAPVQPFPAPSSPGYKPPTVPAAPEYQLPPLPQPPPNESSSASSTLHGRLFVRRIEVRGVKAIPHVVIDSLVAPYQNREVSAQELQDLRVALTRLYIDRGYVNSGVILPDQQVKDGVVLMQAMEGKLTRVRVVGKTHLSEHYLTSRVHAHVDDPLNLSDLQNSLRFLQQDPNVERLDARLSPGDTQGESVLRLSVDDQPRFSAGIGGDNYQSPSIGAEEGRVFFGFRDLTGYGEEFKASGSRSRGNTLGSAVFSIPFTAHNASFQAYYSRGDAVIVQQPFEQLNIKETIDTYGASLTVPLLDRLSSRISIFVGLESDRAYTQLLNTGFSFSAGAQNGRSDVTEALGGLDWLVHGASSVTDLRLTYRRGIDALGATVYNPVTATPFGSGDLNPNPTGADGRFGLEQLQFIHIQRLNGFSLFSHLNDRAQVIVRASGQLTQEPLLSVAKFTVGGVDTVRGFPANSFVRDNGAAATFEVQLPIPGYRAEPSVLNLVVAPFIDYGRSWDKVNADPGNPQNDTSLARYMTAAGLGLLWNPFRGLDLQTYWGRGIANNFALYDPRNYIPHDAQYHGVYFSANYAVKW